VEDITPIGSIRVDGKRVHLDQRIVIYGLTDPRSTCVRYIGQTRDPFERYAGHCRHQPYSRDPRVRWIRELRQNGLKPGLIELEVVPESDAAAVEHFWISSLRSAGASLFNISDGQDTVWTPASRAKLSARKVGQVVSNETREKLRKLATGKRQSSETVDKRRKKLVGRRFNPETIERMTSSAKKRVIADATREALSRAARAQWQRVAAAGFKRSPPRAITEENRVQARRALDEHGSKSRAAKHLGISRKQLRRWLD